MNPCPCGYLGAFAATGKPAAARPTQSRATRARLSGPLLDRIDLQVEVPRGQARAADGRRPTAKPRPRWRCAWPRRGSASCSARVCRTPPSTPARIDALCALDAAAARFCADRGAAAGLVGPQPAPRAEGGAHHRRPGRRRDHRHGACGRGAAAAPLAVRRYAHEAQVALAGVVVRQVREQVEQLAVAQAEPAPERGAELVDRGLGQQRAVAQLVGAAVEVVVVGVLRAQHREVAVQVAAAHRAAHHEVVRAPAVVGAVAVAGEGAAEVRRGEGGDRVAHAHRAERGVEVAQRVRQPGHQVGLVAVLRSCVSKPPMLTKNTWRLACTPPALLASIMRATICSCCASGLKDLRAGQRVVVLQLRVVVGVVVAAGRRGAEAAASLAGFSALRSASSASIERCPARRRSRSKTCVPRVRRDDALHRRADIGRAEDAAVAVGAHADRAVGADLVLLDRLCPPATPRCPRPRCGEHRLAVPDASRSPMRPPQPRWRLRAPGLPGVLLVVVREQLGRLGVRVLAVLRLAWSGMTSGPMLGRMARRLSVSNIVCRLPITGCSAKLRPCALARQDRQHAAQALRRAGAAPGSAPCPAPAARSSPAPGCAPRCSWPTRRCRWAAPCCRRRCRRTGTGTPAPCSRGAACAEAVPSAARFSANGAAAGPSKAPIAPAWRRNRRREACVHVVAHFCTWNSGEITARKIAALTRARLALFDLRLVRAGRPSAPGWRSSRSRPGSRPSARPACRRPAAWH